jgi:membrane protease YdiL (CAAX protease family)
MAFGFTVYATRSIWSGIILHAANNTAAMLGVALDNGEAPQTTGSIWLTGVTVDLWISVCLLLISALAALWIGRQMLATRAGSSGDRGTRFELA